MSSRWPARRGGTPPPRASAPSGSSGTSGVSRTPARPRQTPDGRLGNHVPRVHGRLTDGADRLTRDLGPVLRRTVQDGAAYEPGVVPEALCRAVVDELAAEPFVALAPV